MDVSDFLEYEQINKDKFRLQIREQVLSGATFWKSTMSLIMPATRNIEEKSVQQSNMSAYLPDF